MACVIDRIHALDEMPTWTDNAAFFEAMVPKHFDSRHTLENVQIFLPH